MYSYEERKKAVDLYIKYGKKTSAVIHELGYPDCHILIMWYKDFIKKGKIEIPDLKGNPIYTEEQKQKAVKFYIEHGKSLKFTVSKLGYPSYHLLSKWIDEIMPSEKRIYNKNFAPNYNTSTDDKIKSVVELCTRTDKSTMEIASKYGVDSSTLYFWKNKFMSKKEYRLPDNCNTGNLEKK